MVDTETVPAPEVPETPKPQVIYTSVDFMFSLVSL
jgi:hypothetical protein